MTKYISSKAMCPFYIAENGNKIICEGIAKSSTIHMTFEHPNTKNDYRDSHCCSYYMKCVWAQALCEKKYKE